MQLRPYQQTAIDETLAFLQNKEGNPCIVAPTASGKSLMLAELCKSLAKNNDKKILILSDTKEILEQNYQKLCTLWPFAPIAIYSASLGQKRLNRITVGQIQSIAKKAKDLPQFDYIIIDEVHMLPRSGEGQYRTLLKHQPNTRVIGLTATPYRLDSGLIVGDENILTDISYNISIPELIKDGFLCPVKGKGGKEQADLTGVRKVAGEFVLKEAAERLDNDRITLAALQEVLQLGKERKAWLIFCSGVEHAEKTKNGLRALGVSAEIITGNTLPMARTRIINDFKDGKIKALVNANVLIKGFDAPNVDLLVLLRATASKACYIQMAGRAMRIHPDKQDALILDYGGNLERHGAIDQINAVEKKEKKSKAEDTLAPAKLCPECRYICHASARECLECGYEFPEPKPNIQSSASVGEFLTTFAKPLEYTVLTSDYSIANSKKSGHDMLIAKHKVDANRWITEFICFDHPADNFARRKATQWWKERAIESPLPKTVAEAFEHIHFLYKVKSLFVKKENGFDKIVSAVLDKENLFNINEESHGLW